MNQKQTLLLILLLLSTLFAIELPSITSEEKEKILKHIEFVSNSNSSSAITEMYTSKDSIYYLTRDECSKGSTTGELLARYGYHLSETEDLKLLFLRMRYENALAALDPIIPHYIKKPYNFDKNGFKSIKTYKITKTLLSDAPESFLQWASCYWAISSLNKEDCIPDQIENFKNAFMDYLSLKESTNNTQALPLPKDFRDLAVVKIKEEITPKRLRSLSFSKEDREIISYGLHKDSTDAKLLLFSALIVPFTEKDTIERQRLPFPIFEREKSIFNFSYSDKRPQLTKEENLKRITLIKKAQTLDTTLGIANLFIGHLYDSMGYKDSALAAYNRLNDVAPFNQQGSTEWEKIAIYKLSLLSRLKRYADVIKTYHRVAPHIPNFHTETLYTDIPNAYMKLNQPQKAYEYYYDSCNIESTALSGSADYLKLNWGWGTKLSWIALLAQKYDKVKEIEDHFDKSHFTYRVSTNSQHSPHRDSCNYAVSMMNIGHAYLCENKVDSALSYYTRSREILKRYSGNDIKEEFNRVMNSDFKKLKELDRPLNGVEEVRTKLKL